MFVIASHVFCLCEFRRFTATAAAPSYSPPCRWEVIHACSVNGCAIMPSRCLLRQASIMLIDERRARSFGVRRQLVANSAVHTPVPSGFVYSRLSLHDMYSHSILRRSSTTSPKSKQMQWRGAAPRATAPPRDAAKIARWQLKIAQNANASQVLPLLCPAAVQSICISHF